MHRDEVNLHASLPASVERVVYDKKIILWKSLLQECGYDDMEAVDFMTKGVPLVGTHHHPSCYAVKIKPATLTEGELRESATFCRKALIARKPQTDEPGFAEHLEETAAEEVCIRGGGFRNNRSQPVEDHAPVCERARVQAEAYR